MRPPEKLRDRVLAYPRMEGLDLACGVSTDRRYEVEPVGPERFRVLAYDFGVKAHSPRLLAERGCRVTVIPATTTAQDIMAEAPTASLSPTAPETRRPWRKLQTRSGSSLPAGCPFSASASATS